MPTTTFKPQSVKVSKSVSKSLKMIEADGRTVHVLGSVKNGKLEIDQASLVELAKKFPKANLSFVAVNAPFDPRSEAP